MKTIMERIAAGDESAVAECMDRYGNLVWSLALRFTSDRARAEDAVQEIFIELWSHADRFDPSVASETTFIAMIARRRLIDRFRRESREPGMDTLEVVEAVEAAPAVDPADGLEARQEAERIAAEIGNLKPEQQSVLRLSIYHGISHSKIAERLGLPLGTVKSHARRGLISLRERLGVPATGKATS